MSCAKDGIIGPRIRCQTHADTKEHACSVSREVLLPWLLILKHQGREELTAARERRKGVWVWGTPIRFVLARI
jgi:hypothetical protein